MKHLLQKSWLLVLLVLAGGGAWAQAPTWKTAFLVGGNAYSQIAATATDDAGDVYVTGFFSNATLVLGNITLTNAVTAGSNVGISNDFFLAKWSPATSSFAWAVRAGGTTSSDTGQSLVVRDGSVYVVATLSGSGFGGAAVPAGSYLARFTSAGALVWSAPAPGLVAAGSDGLYVAASFTGTASFGATTLTSAGGSDIVVAKLLDAGSTFGYAWAQRAGGPGNDAPNALTVQGSTLYLAAGTGGSATFGGATTGSEPAGCVARLTDAGSSGRFDWVQAAPGAYARAIAASGGSVYIGGSFTGDVTLGPSQLSAPGSTGYFLARLTDAGSSGSWAWGWQVPQAGPNSVPVTIEALAATPRYVYLSGRLGATATFGPNVLVPVQSDFYVARLTPGSGAGAFDWGLMASATYVPYPAAAISVRGATVFVAGMLAGPVTFGELVLPAAGGPVAFLASLTDNAALPARAATSLPGVAVFPNPARGAATVRVPAGAGAATVRVLDALGREVRQASVPTGQDYRLELGGLVAGLYTVRVQVGEAAGTRQVAVE